ncbi:MAG: hypothetical protein A2Z96_06240 [Spirochaetes bacterium GWB1_48_6]|nr:MAG: hypothetical protein A2Z96_06240 [Spirochaetes bacterium GWB1_48_6]
MELIPGDLIFQCVPSLDFGQAVSAVYKGWKNYPINHVSLVLDRNDVIEANRTGVEIRSIPEFQKKLIHQGQTWVLHGRVNTPSSKYITSAVNWARTQAGKPYNHNFTSGSKSFYCSQLAAEAFKFSAGKAILPEFPMNFKDLHTNQTLPYWEKYYSQQGITVPQGQAGTHPATQSLSGELSITFYELN